MTGSLQNRKTETKLSLENQFERFVSQSKEPQALKDFRKKVFAKFQTLKIPGSENESWRKIPLSNFHPEDFTEVPDFAAVVWKIPDLVKLQRSETLSGKELENFLNILEGIFQKQNEEWFTLYSLSNFTHGLYLEIGNDFVVQEEIEIKFRLEKENKILPLIVAKIGSHNKILIVERYECIEEQELKFFQGLSVLQTGAGSKVSYVGIESFGSSIFHFQNLFSDQREDSDLKIAKVTPGGYKGKIYST